MTAVTAPALLTGRETPDLVNGDRMSREEFHRAYCNTPPGFKAELIGGMVFVASPLKLGHGTPHSAIGALFFIYTAATPGTQCSDNTTVLLGGDAEPQPDVLMRLLPEFGGQTKTSVDDYVQGAPELVAEIALTSRSIDLHLKLDDYRRHGVLEYFVYCVQDSQIRWFDLRNNVELTIDADHVLRVRTFPGLWIDLDALLAQDNAKLIGTVQKGIASPEHAEFVARLAAVKQS